MRSAVQEERCDAATAERSSLRLTSALEPSGSCLQPIRVFIFAEIRLFREGLAEILPRDSRVAVVGTAGCCEDALDRPPSRTGSARVFRQADQALDGANCGPSHASVRLACPHGETLRALSVRGKDTTFGTEFLLLAPARTAEPLPAAAGVQHEPSRAARPSVAVDTATRFGVGLMRR